VGAAEVGVDLNLEDETVKFPDENDWLLGVASSALPNDLLESSSWMLLQL
jgi:hypothetical protein